MQFHEEIFFKILQNEYREIAQHIQKNGRNILCVFTEDGEFNFYYQLFCRLCKAKENS